MFSSLWSAPVDPTAPNFHPVTSNIAPSDLFQELEPEDLHWVCPGGISVETQLWYQTLDDGGWMMCQIIHSAVGMWYPTIQFNCKVFNPKTGLKIWRSVNVTNFVTPATGSTDKRSSKSDQFTIKFKPTSPTDGDSCSLIANVSDDLQISLDVTRPASIPGFKVGKGPRGGFSEFGPDVKNPEGYVVHWFWPRTQSTGHIIYKGQAMSANGVGTFIHAIQGMRPNLVASRWNFSSFHSAEQGGVSAIQMEFTTIDAYGKAGAGSGGVIVNVGGIVLDNKLVAVTGETRWPGEAVDDAAVVQSRTSHIDAKHDPETGYDVPSRFGYIWSGPAIPNAKETIKATMAVDVGEPEAPVGLIDKIDVLAEIPYAIKMVVNYVAGTKPYIYQYLNPATLTLTLPPGQHPTGETVTVNGTLFSEASFIS